MLERFPLSSIGLPHLYHLRLLVVASVAIADLSYKFQEVFRCSSNFCLQPQLFFDLLLGSLGLTSCFCV
jgi:hypothetical protein